MEELSRASSLDAKTRELSYVAVLAALRETSAIPFHVLLAKQAGASRKEVISAVLVGLPAAGHGVTECLPVAIAAFDEE